MGHGYIVAEYVVYVSLFLAKITLRGSDGTALLREGLTMAKERNREIKNITFTRSKLNFAWITNRRTRRGGGGGWGLHAAPPPLELFK